ncbi:MAG: hypothetical protein AAGA30_00670, partial [Planctomycetota bacterium]
MKTNAVCMVSVIFVTSIGWSQSEPKSVVQQSGSIVKSAEQMVTPVIPLPTPSSPVTEISPGSVLLEADCGCSPSAQAQDFGGMMDFVEIRVPARGARTNNAEAQRLWNNYSGYTSRPRLNFWTQPQRRSWGSRRNSFCSGY